MKRRIFTGGAILALALGTANPAFPDVLERGLADLQKNVDQFSENLAKSLPFNATIGLNWADAYIGKLFPSVPPHFGAGGVYGVTTMEMDGLDTLAKSMGFQMPFDIGKMPLPAYAAEARIGGIFAPFDVGVKAGILPPIDLWGTNLSMDYLLAGAEVRYAIMDGKKTPLLPNVSVGVGYNYLKGGIGKTIGDGLQYKFSEPIQGEHTLEVSAPRADMVWEAQVLDFKGQISMSLLAVTPYAGIGVSHAWSKAGYTIDSDVTIDGKEVDADAKALLKAAGLGAIDIDKDGFSSIIDVTGWSFRCFGGASFNLLILRLDITGMYNLMDQNYGLSVGARVQI